MIKNQILKKLNLQTEKFLKTPVDILISGAPGTGKTTWAKNIACRIGKAHRIFEGRGLSYEEFQNQVAHGGTDCVIIEDVEQLSFSDQSRLLLWLNHPDRKIRTIFTCRVDLLDLVKKQNFRSDLFFKISVASLQLPGINEMKEHFSDLVYDLLGVYQILHNRSGISLSETAIRKLTDWTWPGNFSELENVLEKAVLLSGTPELDESDIEITQGKNHNQAILPIKKLSEIEKDLILQTLRITHQNRTKAAEILGISIRTLRNKIQEYREEGFL